MSKLRVAVSHWKSIMAAERKRRHIDSFLYDPAPGFGWMYGWTGPNLGFQVAVTQFKLTYETWKLCSLNHSFHQSPPNQKQQANSLKCWILQYLALYRPPTGAQWLYIWAVYLGQKALGLSWIASYLYDEAAVGSCSVKPSECVPCASTAREDSALWWFAFQRWRNRGPKS